MTSRNSASRSLSLPSPRSIDQDYQVYIAVCNVFSCKLIVYLEQGRNAKHTDIYIYMHMRPSISKKIWIRSFPAIQSTPLDSSPVISLFHSIRSSFAHGCFLPYPRQAWLGYWRARAFSLKKHNHMATPKLRAFRRRVFRLRSSIPFRTHTYIHK